MRCLYTLTLVLGWIVSTQNAYGHEIDAPFTSAIPELIKMHHAHIEDEQRINFAQTDGITTDAGGGDVKRSAFSNTFEMAVTWTEEFNLASEIFVPFSNTGNLISQYEIGDIEIQPVKYAFINEPERVATFALGVEVPTGNEDRGLGEGRTNLGTHFFFDQAWRNWYFGFNSEYAWNVTGTTFSEVELGIALAYSFIGETGKGMAPTRPHQTIVPTITMELVSEKHLSGAEEGENVITILPALQLWHIPSNWQVRFGVDVPVSSDRENDFVVHFQVGNHFDWGTLLGFEH